ncbi:MAG TPA: GtrA family protein [Burkholderiales bacterium]
MIGAFARYSAVSAIGTAVYLILFFALVALPMGAVGASVLAFIPALVIQFLLNYHWTFRSRGEKLPAFGKFAVVSATGLGLNVLVMHAGVNLAGIDPRYVVVLALLAVTINNYTLNRVWSFRFSGKREPAGGARAPGRSS